MYLVVVIRYPSARLNVLSSSYKVPTYMHTYICTYVHMYVCTHVHVPMYIQYIRKYLICYVPYHGRIYHIATGKKRQSYKAGGSEEGTLIKVPT